MTIIGLRVLESERATERWIFFGVSGEGGCMNGLDT